MSPRRALNFKTPARWWWWWVCMQRGLRRRLIGHRITRCREVKGRLKGDRVHRITDTLLSLLSNRAARGPTACVLTRASYSSPPTTLLCKKKRGETCGAQTRFTSLTTLPKRFAIMGTRNAARRLNSTLTTSTGRLRCGGNESRACRVYIYLRDAQISQASAWQSRSRY